MTGRRSRPAWRISASAPSTAATRPNIPTTSSPRRFDRWGVVGINVRAAAPGATLGSQDGLYTRLIREDERVEARVIGSIVSVVDSQDERRAGARRAGLARHRRGDADGHREGLLPPAVERRARPRPSRYRPRPRQSARRRAACPACWCERSTCAGRRMAARSRCSAATTSRPTAHPRQCRADARRPARQRPVRLDRRQRRLPVDHGRPHRAGDIAGRHRHGGAALRLSRRRRRRRRAVPPMGHRGELRRPLPALGSRRRQLRRRRHAVRASQDARAQRRADDALLSRRAGRPRAHVATPSPTRCSQPSCAAC